MLNKYRIFQTIRCTPSIWEENGSASYSPNAAYLARLRGVGRGRWWSGVTGGRRRVTAAGSQQRQEWGDAAGSGLGGGGVPVVQSKGGRSGVPAGAYYSAREEGSGGAGTLGEESLWRPYMPPSRDWCVSPH